MVAALFRDSGKLQKPLSLRVGGVKSPTGFPPVSNPPVDLRAFAFLRAYSRRIVGDSTTGCGDSRYRGNALGSAEVAKLEPLGERLAGYAAPKGSV